MIVVLVMMIHLKVCLTIVVIIIMTIKNINNIKYKNIFVKYNGIMINGKL